MYVICFEVYDKFKYWINTKDGKNIIYEGLITNASYFYKEAAEKFCTHLNRADKKRKYFVEKVL